MEKSGHGAMLEHGTVYLQMPLDKWYADIRIEETPGRTRVVMMRETNTAFVTTNYRVLVENGCLDLLEYLCDTPGPMHELRVTARFNLQIAISREYNRHRMNSVAEQSTRYCNYSKEKYNSEISVSLPSFLSKNGIAKNIATINKHQDLRTFVDFISQNGFDEMKPIEWWLFANMACETAYMKLIECGWPAQYARTILPLDTNTVLVHTAFVSDWKHFFDLRSLGITGNPHPDAKYLSDNLLEMFIEKGYIKKDYINGSYQ